MRGRRAWSEARVTHLPVRPRTRALARAQRREPTQAERLLWGDLRGRRLAAWKFRRQVPIGPYVVDFVCFEARLIVELDGGPHDAPDQQAHDHRRDDWLESQGFRIVRFSNDLILGGSTQLVVDEVTRALKRPADPSSDPASPGHLLPQGEKGARTSLGALP